MDPHRIPTDHKKKFHKNSFGFHNASRKCHRRCFGSLHISKLLILIGDRMHVCGLNQIVSEVVVKKQSFNTARVVIAPKIY